MLPKEQLSLVLGPKQGVTRSDWGDATKLGARRMILPITW